MANIGEGAANVEWAKELMFKVHYNEKQGYSFTKERVHIWPMRIGYQCADLIDDYYTNHRPYDTLREALWGEA